MLPTIVSQHMPRNTARRVRIAIERVRILTLPEPAPAAVITAVPWELMTREQTARRLNCSAAYVDELERSGRLLAVREGKWVRFDIREVMRFAEASMARNRAEIERAA
jgi:excisionase family DNA binding protein